MKEQIITIHKDNYKGYVKLYKLQQIISKKRQENLQKYLISILLIFATTAISLITTSIFAQTLKLSLDYLLMFEGTIGVLGVEAISIITDKKIKKFKTEKYQALAKEYPYVELDTKETVLEDSLENVGLLSCQHLDKVCIVSLRVEEYETVLKMEEIKDELLQETKYDRYVINPEITEEDLKGQKVKVKSLVR